MFNDGWKIKYRFRWDCNLGSGNLRLDAEYTRHLGKLIKTQLEGDPERDSRTIKLELWIAG